MKLTYRLKKPAKIFSIFVRGNKLWALLIIKDANK